MFFVMLIALSATAVAEISHPDRAARITREHVAFFARARTVGALLESTKASIDPKLFQFLKAKSRGVENVSYQVKTDVGGSFSIQVEKTYVNYRFLEVNADGNVAFEVNHKRVLYDSNATADEIWRRVIAAMPLRKSAAWTEYLLPPAEAAGPVIVMAMAAGPVIAVAIIHVIAVADVANTENCRLYAKYNSECAGSDVAALIRAAEFARTNWLSFSCGAAAGELRQCLQARGRALAAGDVAAIPTALRGSFGLSRPGGARVTNETSSAATPE